MPKPFFSHPVWCGFVFPVMSMRRSEKRLSRRWFSLCHVSSVAKEPPLTCHPLTRGDFKTWLQVWLLRMIQSCQWEWCLLVLTVIHQPGKVWAVDYHTVWGTKANPVTQWNEAAILRVNKKKESGTVHQQLAWPLRVTYMDWPCYPAILTQNNVSDGYPMQQDFQMTQNTTEDLSTCLDLQKLILVPVFCRSDKLC